MTIKSNNKTFMYLFTIILSVVVIITLTASILVVTKNSNFIPKAEAYGGCTVSYNNHTALNKNCFRGRHVVRVGSGWQVASWVSASKISISPSYTNETAFGSDAHEFSPEAVYLRTYTVY